MTRRCAVPWLLIPVVLWALACAHSESSAPRPVASHEHPEGMPHRFEHAEQWAQQFDEPGREAWQKPDEVLRALGLPEDARVADVGSGTGYFTVRLARAVPRGRVYGVDVEPDMGRYLGERARREGLDNVVPVLATSTDSKLPEPVDLVLIVDTYHHLGDRVAYLRQLGAVLRPGGRVAVIDFREASPKGPPARHKLSPEQVREDFQAAGYHPVQAHDFLPDQFFLVFQRG